jgi:hypothetical protein
MLAGANNFDEIMARNILYFFCNCCRHEIETILRVASYTLYTTRSTGICDSFRISKKQSPLLKEGN